MGMKWPGCVAVNFHLVPRSRMCGSLPPVLYVLMVWCLKSCQLSSVQNHLNSVKSFPSPLTKSELSKCVVY
jgi:hypothetical protein